MMFVLVTGVSGHMATSRSEGGAGNAGRLHPAPDRGGCARRVTWS